MRRDRARHKIPTDGRVPGTSVGSWWRSSQPNESESELPTTRGLAEKAANELAIGSEDVWVVAALRTAGDAPVHSIVRALQRDTRRDDFQ